MEKQPRTTPDLSNTYILLKTNKYKGRNSDKKKMKIEHDHNKVGHQEVQCTLVYAMQDPPVTG
jgi:hypothetical protein